MSNGITLNLSELKSTLREYVKYTKRDLPTILNTMGFYISRAAVNNTRRVEALSIRTELEQLIRPFVKTKTGFARKTTTVKRFDSQGRQIDVPLVALLINAKRGKSGQKGLQGRDMSEASRKFIGNRVKSAAFIASGFIPAVKEFEPLAEKKGQAQPMNREAQQRGAPKGYGLPARSESAQVQAIISNLAQSRDDNGRALELYGTEGLQRGVNDEIRSKQKYIEEKMQETANKFNAR